MLYSQEPSIIGPQEVCGGCHEYSVEFQATGEERYEWVYLPAITSLKVSVIVKMYKFAGTNLLAMVPRLKT
jgi:hypothetical protein